MKTPALCARGATVRMGQMAFPTGKCRIVIALWLLFSVVLFLAGLMFLVTGAFYGRGGLWLFATGALSLFVAVPTIAAFVWYFFCRGPSDLYKHEGKNGGEVQQISSISGRETFPSAQGRSLSEAEIKSDYPMGPLLIMTLPKPKDKFFHFEIAPTEAHFRENITHSATSSLESTPDFRPKRPNRKNFPPLASMDTLTPSLKSSFVSIDS